MKWLVSYPENGPSVAWYLGWLGSAGIEASLLSPDFTHPGNVSGFEALLLAGGPDVDPRRYGDAETHPSTYGISAARDAVELRLTEEFLSDRRPVFGICRGIQVINVARGGGLIQHVPDFLGAGSPEIHSRQNTYDVRHPVVLSDGTGLGEALRGVREVNSSHHQAVRPDAIGRGLRVVARTPGGIIEALESDRREDRIVAVQWHPERLAAADPASGRLLAHLLAVARAGRA